MTLSGSFVFSTFSCQLWFWYILYSKYYGNIIFAEKVENNFVMPNINDIHLCHERTYNRDTFYDKYPVVVYGYILSVGSEKKAFLSHIVIDFSNNK